MAELPGRALLLGGIKCFLITEEDWAGIVGAQKRGAERTNSW
ncbi:hypothetical protein ACVWZL_009183 [Bradyrhizobium sp. GM2.4]